MSDTCIVCLGDLSTGPEDVLPPSSTLAKSPTRDGIVEALQLADHDIISSHDTKPKITTEAHDLIAHLIPCGHDLHNECLKPWVERANSCPICRASFHLVELKATVGGDPVSSYSVEERTQVAELDPSIFLELPEEEDDEPCQVCGEEDNEDVLMYSDGCSKLFHTYCVGLDDVPRGAWFCVNCRNQRAANVRPTYISSASRPLVGRRTRGQRRRQRRNAHAHDANWNQVWHTIWSNTNIDLDFPHDDDDASARIIRQHRQRDQASRHVHDAWLRRQRVAELIGAGNRFRESEPVLAAASSPISGSAFNGRSTPPVPHPRSEEEISAWNAFDQARSSPAAESVSRRKKRKASTPPAQVEDGATSIPIKRRRVSPGRTRSVPVAPSSSNAARLPPRRESPPSRPPPTSAEAGGPSFLQSLLQEVEESSATAFRHPQLRTNIPAAASPPSEHYSPRPSSPALSPQPSNHSSPRAMSATPPPALHVRPNSPAGLSSSIQPVYPSTNYSPLRTNSPEPAQDQSPTTNGTQNVALQVHTTGVIVQPAPKGRNARIVDPASSPSLQARPPPVSSARPDISLNHKQDVQKLVSAVLKPHYNEHIIDKEQYTNINRDVSRMLYDRIGDFHHLGVDERAKWEQVAGEEVDKAIGILRASA